MSHSRGFLASLLPFTLLASTAACSSPTAEEPEVFTEDATEVVATFKDGFAAKPVGAPRCSGPDATYTLRLPSRELEIERCGAAPTKRVLGPAEASAVDASLKALRVQKAQRCFSDMPVIRVTIKAPSGVRSYRDGENFCSDDGNTYVEGAGELLAELRKLEK